MKTERLEIRLTPELKDQLNDAATSENRSVSNYVEDALKRAVDDSQKGTISDEEIRAAAGIFALCYHATKSHNEADLSNAQRFPLKFAVIYAQKLRAMHKNTEELELHIANLYDKIDLNTMRYAFDKCLTLQKQGVWMLEFMKY
uniref:Uncharacterized protein n=1 Tax=Siphoviridae sp. ct9lR64 TaxID=2826178 RepID=A0A8S5QYQ3_9CAUD|nr:MAG TPA: hypothetical protein [Siphoviridae sp. ct9lR64]